MTDKRRYSMEQPYVVNEHHVTQERHTSTKGVEYVRTLDANRQTRSPLAYWGYRYPGFPHMRGH